LFLQLGSYQHLLTVRIVEIEEATPPLEEDRGDFRMSPPHLEEIEEIEEIVETLAPLTF
jgi:hypothetical protein